MARRALEICIPPFFTCPISLDLMKDPVSTCTGVTYDRASIEKWIDGGNITCPATLQPLHTKELIPNHTLRRLIQAWCGANAAKGVERIPTPKTPANSQTVTCLFREIQLGGANRMLALQKLRGLARDSVRNAICISDEGGAEVLAGVLRGGFKVYSVFFPILMKNMDYVTIWNLLGFNWKNSLKCVNPFLKFVTCSHFTMDDEEESIYVDEEHIWYTQVNMQIAVHEEEYIHAEDDRVSISNIMHNKLFIPTEDGHIKYSVRRHGNEYINYVNSQANPSFSDKKDDNICAKDTSIHTTIADAEIISNVNGAVDVCENKSKLELDTVIISNADGVNDLSENTSLLNFCNEVTDKDIVDEFSTSVEDNLEEVTKVALSREKVVGKTHSHSFDIISCCNDEDDYVVVSSQFAHMHDMLSEY